jgi:hypothetical protein
MGKTFSYFVLAIMAIIGLVSVYQINGVTSVLKQFNEEEKNRGWDSDPYYDDGAIEPEPTDYAEPTME